MSSPDDIRSLFHNVSLSFKQENRKKQRGAAASGQHVHSDLQTDAYGSTDSFCPNTRKKCRKYMERSAAKHCSNIEYGLFMTMLHKPRRWRRILPKKDAFHALSINGGAGTDVVALCSVFSQLGCPFCKLKLTVMEPENVWRPVFQRLVAYLSSHQEYSRIGWLFRAADVRTNFILADITRYPLPNELSEADLIMVTNLSQRMHLKERCSAIKMIFSLMKGGSICVLNDVGLDVVRRLVSEEKFEILYTNTSIGNKKKTGHASFKKRGFEIYVVRKSVFVYITETAIRDYDWSDSMETAS